MQAEAFIFLELFAGHGGFTGAVRRCCGDAVKVLEGQDEWTTEWDIRKDVDFEKARVWCREADHTHFAPPCRSMTRARRSDEHGTVPVIRSEERPEGWGHPVAEEGNQIAERTANLVDCVEEGRGTFSIENPFDSYLWELRTMKRHVAKHTKVRLDQCVYGAETKKPTGILTSADWMKEVCGLCQEAPDHNHLEGGLSGKTLDYFHDPPVEVWRSALAAEYPAGLCWSWAKALKRHLEAPGVRDRLAARSNVATTWNKFQRKEDVLPSPGVGWKEQREWENQKAIGGLRNPYQAVARLPKAWKAGSRLKAAILRAMRREATRLPARGEGLKRGLEPRLVQAAVEELAGEFGTSPTEEANPYRSKLLAAMLRAAGDPEEDVPVWMEHGYPLGIEAKLGSNAVFPETDGDTKAVEMSRTFQTLTQLMEVEGAKNYKSFEEAGEPAEEELERICAASSWGQVETLVGKGATLTKMGCIQKPKPDGTVKTRLIVDMRRSGVNGLMRIRQRVVLPRVTDVATSWQQLKRMYPHHWFILLVVDFKDAFYTCRLAPQEKKYAVVKGRKGYYVLNVVAFGLACGPLLWGRTAAAFMRLASSMLPEGRLQCYVDDPIMVLGGADGLEHHLHIIMTCLLWQALGSELAWTKLQLGKSASWIGFQLDLHEDTLVAQLAPEKLTKLRKTLEELRQKKGMIPLNQLRSLAGLLGWVTSIIAFARPWVSMVWGAVTEAEARMPKQARQRKNLVFTKQVSQALEVLTRLTSSGELRVTFHHAGKGPKYTIQTDASPWGFGAILWGPSGAEAWWAQDLQCEDLAFLQGSKGDPAWQSEWEFMAIVLSVSAFGDWISGQAISLLADNTGVLHPQPSVQ